MSISVLACVSHIRKFLLAGLVFGFGVLALATGSYASEGHGGGGAEGGGGSDDVTGVRVRKNYFGKKMRRLRAHRKRIRSAPPDADSYLAGRKGAKAKRKSVKKVKRKKRKRIKRIKRVRKVPSRPGRVVGTGPSTPRRAGPVTGPGSPEPPAVKPDGPDSPPGLFDTPFPPRDVTPRPRPPVVVIGPGGTPPPEGSGRSDAPPGLFDTPFPPRSVGPRPPAPAKAPARPESVPTPVPAIPASGPARTPSVPAFGPAPAPSVPALEPASPAAVAARGPNSSTFDTIAGGLNTISGYLTDGIPGGLAGARGLGVISSISPSEAARTSSLLNTIRGSRAVGNQISDLGGIMTIGNLTWASQDMMYATNSREYSKSVDRYMRTAAISIGSLLGAQAGVAAGALVAASAALPTGGLGAVVGVISVPVLGVGGALTGGVAAGLLYDAFPSGSVKEVARDYYAGHLDAYSP